MKVKNERFFAVIIFLFIIMFCAACTEQTEQIDDETVLRIGLMHSSLSQQYTDLYQIAHPNVEIEFQAAQERGNIFAPNAPADDPVEVLKEQMQSANPPDVIILPYDEYKQLLEENMFVALDLWLDQSELSTDQFVPLVLDLLRSEQDQQIYGLSPAFRSYALAYNKDIFTSAGVELPRDHMTLEEVFALARAVTVKDPVQPVYGFSFDPINYGEPEITDIYQFALPSKDIPILNDDDQLSDEWRQIVEQIYADIMDGVYPPSGTGSEPVNGVMFNPFLSGRLAMGIVNYPTAHQFNRVMSHAEHMENFEPFEWDVVTLPAPNSSTGAPANVRFDQVLAINANSQNQELAWDFIRFVHDDWMKANIWSNYLISRTDLNIPVDFNEEAFYTFNRAFPSDRLYEDRFSDSSEMMSMRMIWGMTFSGAANGMYTLEQMIEQLEQQFAGLGGNVDEN